MIHEDDPGWDCATMGNMICGPLPDTSMAPPDGTVDITGLVVVASIIITATYRKLFR